MYRIDKLSLENIQSFLLALSILFFMYPSFTWDKISIITPLAFGLLVFALLIEISIHNSINIKSYLFIFIFYYYVYVNLVGISLTDSFFTTQTLVSTLFLVFSFDTIRKSFDFFFKIFGILLGLSILIFLLKQVGIYTPSLKEQLAPDGREYLNYLFNTMWIGTQYNGFYLSTGFYRFHSFLNEPGFIGTIASLIVVAYRFNFKKHKLLYVYLVAAVLSMSLAAIITLLFGVLYYISFKKLFYFGLTISIISVFNFDLLERYVINRLIIDEGKFSGDNRTSQQFDFRWRELIQSKEVILGLGQGQHTKTIDHRGGVSSWKSIVYNTGVVGLIFYVFIFITIALVVKRFSLTKRDFFIMFVFFMTVYHRPNIHLIYYLLIFFGALLYKDNSQPLQLNNTVNDEN